VVKTGSGTLTFPNANTYTGPTTVSNGMLIINGNNAAVSTTVYGTNGALGGTGTLAGAVTLNAGTTLAPGASVGTLTINNNLSIGGNLAIEVNKSLAQSNDLVVVTGVLANTGTGILTVKNLGPNIAPGDKFTLFSKPMVNGTALSITGARANWTNTLALDGSIRVLSIAPPPVLNSTRIGNSLQFSWSDSYSTFKLQAQTNGTLVGLGTNWADYPGGSISPITVPILPVNNTFYRLKLVSTP
jgi:autotransporter-associated beta strand protein